MYEGIRSPAVHMPKTMSDLVSASTRFPNATFWAGGTYIMSRHDYYPTRDSNDIIYLAGVPELNRINRTDRFLEIGSIADRWKAGASRPVIHYLGKFSYYDCKKANDNWGGYLYE